MAHLKEGEEQTILKVLNSESEALKTIATALGNISVSALVRIMIDEFLRAGKTNFKKASPDARYLNIILKAPQKRVLKKLAKDHKIPLGEAFQEILKYWRENGQYSFMRRKEQESPENLYASFLEENIDA